MFTKSETSSIIAVIIATALLEFLVLWFVAYQVALISEKPPEVRVERTPPTHHFHQQCPGCDSWFWCESENATNPPEIIKAPCPLCPMSDEEFKQLQDQLRKERDNQ